MNEILGKFGKAGFGDRLLFGVGTGTGITFGAVAGSLFGNVGLGVGLGICFGAAIAAVVVHWVRLRRQGASDAGSSRRPWNH